MFDNIVKALRSSVEEEERKVAAADHILRMLKTAVGEWSDNDNALRLMYKVISATT